MPTPNVAPTTAETRAAPSQGRLAGLRDEDDRERELDPMTDDDRQKARAALEELDDQGFADGGSPEVRAQIATAHAVLAVGEQHPRARCNRRRQLVENPAAAAVAAALG
jgi:hypothetical protein